MLHYFRLSGHIQEGLPTTRLGIRYFRANIMLLLLYIARSLSTSHNALRLLCVLILCVGNDLPLYNMANPRLQHFSDRPEKSREIGAFSCDISNPETLSDLNRGDQGVCERDQKSWFCSTIFLRWLIFHIGGQQGGRVLSNQLSDRRRS
jgi:hypothetical protein